MFRTYNLKCEKWIKYYNNENHFQIEPKNDLFLRFAEVLIFSTFLAPLTIQNILLIYVSSTYFLSVLLSFPLTDLKISNSSKYICTCNFSFLSNKLKQKQMHSSEKTFIQKLGQSYREIQTENLKTLTIYKN